MRKLVALFILLTFALSIWKCETEVNLNDEWQDIPVVYGLLNQKDKVHYVRINKAFLGEGNALKMASNLDSITYPDILDVKLLEKDGNNIIRTIPLDTTMIHDVDSGAFHYPNQIIYRTQGQNVSLSSDYTYKLSIYNTQRKKYIEAETDLIQNFSIKRPLAGQTFANFTSTFPTEVKWRTAKNGRLYELSIRAYYTNYYDSGNVEHKQFEWEFPQRIADNLNGGDEMSLEIVGKQFYEIAKNNIPAKDNLERTMDSVRYIVAVADDEFNTYLKVNKPSNTIIQERPEYSNISNGIGLFASRYSEFRTLLLNSDSQDTLVSGQKTRHLNFRKPIP